MDSNLSFGHQIRRTVEKASRTVLTLVRLMLNVEEPSTGKRKVLVGVINSVILYGAPICCEALPWKIRKHGRKMQRQLQLKVASACRTVTLQAIAKVIPLNLLAEERRILFAT